MEQYIKKSTLVSKIEKRIKEINLDSIEDWRCRLQREHDIEVMKNTLSLIDTLDIKEINEVPATVVVNKYGNRFISSWPGLKEYDDFKEGQEIKILIPKK